MKYLLDKSSSYFDFFENHWNNKKTKSIIWFIIVLSFIFLGFAIEINKIFLSGMFNLPNDLFYSINFVFNLILFYEMIDLIFIMSKSFSIAISKQMEIYSLILVRDSFKLVSDVSDENIFLNYNENFNLFNIFDILLKSDLFVMVSSIFGAVIVYILILKFKESYSRSVEINKNEDIDLFIKSSDENQELKNVIKDIIKKLDNGELRIAEKINEKWTVNQWLKKAVLLSFIADETKTLSSPGFVINDSPV